MLDAWLRYDFSRGAAIQAGRMLLPYSREFYTHPGNLLFTDLSLADYAFNLPRAVGFGASGKAGRLSYDGVVANSVRALDGAGQRNHGRNLAFVGRLEYDILKPYGYMESLPGEMPVKPQFSAGVAAAYNPVDEGSAFQVTKPGDRTWNFTADSGFRWRRMSVQAAVYSRLLREDVPPRPAIRDWGHYAQGGMYLIPRTLEVAGRVSRVRFGHRATPELSNGATESTVGVNYYIRGHHFKAQSDYSLIRHDSLHGWPGDNHRVRVQLQILY